MLVWDASATNPYEGATAKSQTKTGMPPTRPERSRRVSPPLRDVGVSTKRSRSGFPPWQSPAARHLLLAIARNLLALLGMLLSPCSASAADCIPIHEARQHVGETKCVTGKVVRVKVGVKNTHFLDFCEDEIACPFSVVVFSHDLKDVGDVRRLAGRTIEIQGAVKLYDGRPEIILSRISQISGGAALIPALPKNYDVEDRGHYSAGRLHPTKKPKKTKAKPNTTATYGDDVEGDDPE